MAKQGHVNSTVPNVIFPGNVKNSIKVMLMMADRTDSSLDTCRAERRRESKSGRWGKPQTTQLRRTQEADRAETDVLLSLIIWFVKNERLQNLLDLQAKQR